MRAVLTLLGLAASWTQAVQAQAQAQAQTVIVSAAPTRVSVTLYHSRDYRADREMNLEDPEGYALITETRTITLPAGEAVIRFEGVAGNILPATALLAGLPDGVEEKNLDASLLSPRSLFDRALGRRVIIKRTDKATGKVTLQQATIRSSADGAAILQVAGSYVDLQCSGMPETLVYDGVPPGLSAKPTLSMRTISKRARTVTVTLSYLAGGFDWQSNYIVAMRPDGRSADMFAWITLASSDVTSFPNADLQVVAGDVARDDDSEDDENFGVGDDDELTLKCWPMPQYDLASAAYVPGAPAPPAAVMASDEDLQDIVVTGSRVRVSMQAVPIAVTAAGESLGDLRLYRFPRRVTVASNGQKQVAMLNQPAVKLWPVYSSLVREEDAEPSLLLRGRNIAANGLGIALPGGKVAVFNQVAGRSLLIGEASFEDKTVGEDVEFDLGNPESVTADVEASKEKGRKTRYELTVTNANPWPIAYEAKFRTDGGRELLSPTRKLGRKDGMPFWSVTIPANDSIRIGYTIREPKSDDDD